MVISTAFENDLLADYTVRGVKDYIAITLFCGWLSIFAPARCIVIKTKCGFMRDHVARVHSLRLIGFSVARERYRLLSDIRQPKVAGGSHKPNGMAHYLRLSIDDREQPSVKMSLLKRDSTSLLETAGTTVAVPTWNVFSLLRQAKCQTLSVLSMLLQIAVWWYRYKCAGGCHLLAGGHPSEAPRSMDQSKTGDCMQP